jgi:Cdc6-like AAA superfamily ATPase
MAKRISPQDALAKRFEANQIFTPSTPITIAELFAGRQRQMFRIVDAIGERGRHVILFGERGVGKTSLAQIVPYIIPAPISRIRFCRIQCYPVDTFSSICGRIFKEIRFFADIGEGEKEHDVSEIYGGNIQPDDLLREMSRFTENDIPVVVIDEFNEISDEQAPILLANAVKALSDAGINVTMIVVGVADNVTHLIKHHESIARCTEEILMPRMDTGELREILDKRLGSLGMKIAGDARWKVINLSKGLPAYVHALGKLACFAALDRREIEVTEDDVDSAIHAFIMSSDQTFKDAYEDAVRSNQPGNLFRHVLTACAVAPTDESGYFTPVAVRQPLTSVLKRPVEIANFQNHLAEFADAKRGRILQRIGTKRAYRFRFRQPAMQPYVIMKGIADEILDESARRALSYPEQPDLFPADA